jgi:hypothetical protein
MKIEDTKGKFETELKWGSYYFITTLILSFIYAFLLLLIYIQYWEKFINFNVLVYFILFAYFSFKCIQEIKHEKRVGFFSKLAIGLRIFVIQFILMSCVYNITGVFIIPKNEIEIQETNEQISNSNNNLLKDFIAFVKTKIQ